MTVMDGRRRVVGLPAHVEAVDGVVTAVLADVVQHPGQDAVVHQVAGDLDGFAHTHACTPTGSVPGGRGRPGQSRAPSSAGSRGPRGIGSPGRRTPRRTRPRAGSRASPAGGRRPARPSGARRGRRRSRPTPAAGRGRRAARGGGWRDEALLVDCGATSGARPHPAGVRGDARLGRLRARRLVGIDREAVPVVLDDRAPGVVLAVRLHVSGARPRGARALRCRTRRGPPCPPLVEVVEPRSLVGCLSRPHPSVVEPVETTPRLGGRACRDHANPRWSSPSRPRRARVRRDGRGPGGRQRGSHGARRNF